MKTTIKLGLRKSEKHSDGTANIKIVVIHRRMTRYISTEYDCNPDLFDLKNETLLPGGKNSQADVDRINGKLQVSLAIAKRKAFDQKNLRTIDIKSLLEILRDKRPEYDLFSVLNQRMEQFKAIGNINYHDTIKRTKNAIEGYSGEYLLRFETITDGWLKNFEYHLRQKGLKSNTIGIYMRDIRTAYNQAITMGLAEYGSYPFRKYRIPKEPTRHRTLTAKELSTIAHIELKNPYQAWARDMFMLSFYLIGINIRDLCFIPKVEDGRIYYVRSKGKKHYSIKVWPEAQAIIDRYPGKKYMMDAMDRYTDYRGVTWLMDAKLKDIATACKIDKKISQYYCRHSWATIGISKAVGLSKDDIRYALGHSTGGVTDTYIDYNQDVIDRANRKVINHVLKTPPGVQPL